MKHLGTQIIETERLILRPLTVNDAQAMYENWASSEIATKYMPWDKYTEIETAVEYLKSKEIQYQSSDVYDWGIVIKENNTLIGNITFVGLSERHKVIEIGFIIGDNWWGNEYVVEAARALFEFAFNKLGIHRIQAMHATSNLPSGRVLEKLGMQYEGTHRENRILKGEFVSLKHYAILASDLKN